MLTRADPKRSAVAPWPCCSACYRYLFNPPLWRSLVPGKPQARSCRRSLFRFLNIFAGFVGVLAASSGLSQSANTGSGSLTLAPALEQAGKTYITRSALEAPIRFLSSDALEGRGPASRGDQLTRLYLATGLEGMGYQPAFANGQWQQPFDIVGIKADMPR